MAGLPQYFAVIGHPIGHSLSPRMHGPALAAKGGVYLAFDVVPEHLSEALQGLFVLGFGGVNVTLPHKEEALRLARAESPAARAIGAANTLARRPDGWFADNTDAEGFLRSLPRQAFRAALVLGAGGAARAVVYALKEARIPLRLTARRRERAELLARRFDVELVPWERREEVAFDLLVNATSAGQRPEDEVPFTAFRCALPGALVYDLIYNPPETTFLRLAREAGLATQNGLEMLVQQAVLAWRLWFGHDGPAEAFRDALQGGG